MKVHQRILHILAIGGFMVFFSHVTLFAQNGTVFFNPDTTVVSPLDSFEVNIEVDANLTGIHCFMVSVHFDTSLIQLLDVFEGPLLPGQGMTFFFWNDDIFPYDIGSCLMSYGLYADGPGVLATMKFRAVGQAGVTPLTFTHVEFSDTSIPPVQIPVDSSHGAVIVSGDQSPSVYVTSPASGGIYNSLPTLTIDMDDDMGLDRGYYQIDACTGAWTELWSYNSNSSDTTINWPVPGVSEGSHTIHFRVIDDAGNANGDTCTYAWTFTYDVTEPTVQVTSPPSGGTYNYLPTLTIDLDDDVGLDRGYYQVDGCTGAWTELWSYNSGSSDTTIDWPVPGVSEGSHDIYFKTADDAGNRNGDTCSYFWSFTYDITPPPPPTLISPPDSIVTNDSTPTFIWSSTAGSGGTYTLQYATDALFTDAVTVSGLQDTTYDVLTPLSDDNYYWHVKATDRASNESGYQTRPFMFTINTGAPSVPDLLTPEDSSVTCDFTPTFTWTGSSLILAGGSGTETGGTGFSSWLAQVTYTLQYSPDPSFTEATTIEGIAENTHTVPDTTALDDTTYHWRVEAVDQADNHSGYQEHPFQFTVFVGGDVNRDGIVNVGDVVYLVSYLYKGGPPPDPLEAGDANSDGIVNVGDVVYLVSYLYKAGPPPVCES
ncbi:MAG: Ig-like domain-containing protein [bacterium]